MFMEFKEFESRIRSDRTFSAKFQGLTDSTAIISLAKSEGYNISMDDFSEELSDEELDNVAGGILNLHPAAQFKKRWQDRKIIRG